MLDAGHLEGQEGLDHVLEIAVLVVMLVRVDEHTARSGRVEAHAEDLLQEIRGGTTKGLVSTLK